MSLPSENEFTISYQLKPNSNTVGDFAIVGKFSFISESERKNIEIPVADFTVVSEELIAGQSEADGSLEKESLETIQPKAEIKYAIQALVPEIEKDSFTVNCNRTIEQVNNRKFKVTLKVDKNDLEGFAKISEIIPEGFIATEMDSKGGIFSFKKNKIKILWLEVPDDAVYVVNYFIEAKESLTSGNYEIVGQYFYLYNDISTKSAIDKINFIYTAQELVAEEPTIETPVLNEESNTINKEPETIQTETLLEHKETENTVMASIENVTTTPNPEHGVTYKVQVGAGHKTVSDNYFNTKFNLKDPVSTINHEGWIKYLVGSFDEYKLARDQRNLARISVKTAFVTAYNSGIRITVQEALMISRQIWYK
jgi:hypothetical protein